jgi:hypothetical protein
MNEPTESNINDDKKNFPVREGQGKDSSIRSDKERASGDDSGNSDSYPQPSSDDKKYKNQDEYNHVDKEKENESI